ncbi:tRNA pseudouridine synthase Pus10 isoform X2 [Venturia canescens]|uniref:tRNA pseudouridine synthase Pus10 isoform X2 n=1 Tax=Venturia canescens TaxID=32260 RepID=UPI001C9BF452|nr:tRNA pseudouridine synthase Pus10 isoform X2 [Venturia canescens]
MDFISHETECKMFGYLRDIGCCITCSLRFVGTRNLESFGDPASSAEKMKYVAEGEKIMDDKNVPCITCLGILQQGNTQKHVLENIINAVKKSDHDDPTFNTALTLPICLFLRERSVQYALTEKFELTEVQTGNLKLKTQNVKEIWKSTMAMHLENGMNKKMVSSPIPSPFLIEICFSHENDTPEIKSLSSGKKNESQILSRKTMENTLGCMTKEKFQANYTIPPTRLEKFVEIEPIVCVRSSLFLGGRYAKYSRELSQTPWFINGEKKMETSVQDLICGSMIELTKADSVKFLSSGREDVDVRNIHSGRPFAVELVNPKITIINDEQLEAVVRNVNESTNMVKLTTKLKFLDTSDLKRLKEGENTKTKVYRALCTFKNASKKSINLEKLNALKDVDIVQKTPLRVLHRRPLMPRVRRIHAMRTRWLRQDEVKKLRERNEKTSDLTNISHIENLFVLDVKTQAGTYVKEFVHGDFGRTRPSLGDILEGEFDIVALDVTAINLDWP